MAPEEEEFDIFSWKTIMAIAVVIMLVLSLFFGYDIISGTQDPYESFGDISEDGDTVYVNYTGRFVDGTVFDTTYRDVAENNNLYPKVRTFEVKSLYQPYNFILGNGAMIMEYEMPAFDDEVRGMKVGQSRSITFTPEDGFGPVNPDLFETIDLVESAPLYDETLNITDFRTTYSIEPQTGLTFKHLAGWNSSVYFVDYMADVVTIKHEPYIGEVVDYNGIWSTEITSVDNSANNGDGEIMLKHLLTSSDVGILYGATDIGEFIVSGVDQTAGTATLDYNHIGAGKELVFEITLESIEKS